MVEDQRVACSAFSGRYANPGGLLNFLSADNANQVYFHSTNWFIYLGMPSQLMMNRIKENVIHQQGKKVPNEK